MTYLIIARDHPDALPKRMQVREAHLKLAKQLKEAGKLLYGVAIMERGEMKGSVMVMDFETEEEFEKWKKEEPYINGQVWGQIEINECAVPPLFK